MGTTSDFPSMESRHKDFQLLFQPNSLAADNSTKIAAKKGESILYPLVNSSSYNQLYNAPSQCSSYPAKNYSCSQDAFDKYVSLLNSQEYHVPDISENLLNASKVFKLQAKYSFDLCHKLGNDYTASLQQCADFYFTMNRTAPAIIDDIATAVMALNDIAAESVQFYTNLGCYFCLNPYLINENTIQIPTPVANTYLDNIANYSKVILEAADDIATSIHTIPTEYYNMLEKFYPQYANIISGLMSNFNSTSSHVSQNASIPFYQTVYVSYYYQPWFWYYTWSYWYYPMFYYAGPYYGEYDYYLPSYYDEGSIVDNEYWQNNEYSQSLIYDGLNSNSDFDQSEYKVYESENTEPVVQQTEWISDDDSGDSDGGDSGGGDDSAVEPCVDDEDHYYNELKKHLEKEKDANQSLYFDDSFALIKTLDTPERLAAYEMALSPKGNLGFPTINSTDYYNPAALKLFDNKSANVYNYNEPYTNLGFNYKLSEYHPTALKPPNYEKVVVVQKKSFPVSYIILIVIAIVYFIGQIAYCVQKDKIKAARRRAAEQKKQKAQMNMEMGNDAMALTCEQACALMNEANTDNNMEAVDDANSDYIVEVVAPIQTDII